MKFSHFQSLDHISTIIHFLSFLLALYQFFSVFSVLYTSLYISSSLTPLSIIWFMSHYHPYISSLLLLPLLTSSYNWGYLSLLSITMIVSSVRFNPTLLLLLPLRLLTYDSRFNLHLHALRSIGSHQFSSWFTIITEFLSFAVFIAAFILTYVLIFSNIYILCRVSLWPRRSVGLGEGPPVMNRLS